MNRLQISIFLSLASSSILYPLANNNLENHTQEEKAEQLDKIPNLLESFDQFDIEFSDDEIQSYEHPKKPTPIILYLREFGANLLMHYLTLKNYLIGAWIVMKSKIST